MKYILLGIIIGIIILVCALLISLYARHYYKKIQGYKQIEQDISKHVEELNDKYSDLSKKYKETEDACQEELQRKERAQNDADLIERYNEKMRTQADQSAQAYYDQALQTTQTRLDIALEKAAERYRKAESEYQEEYTQAISDMAATAANYGEKAKQLLASIADLQSKQQAAIEANKRQAEEENKRDYYRIQIPDSDLLEISKLREILPYLRDQDTLNKVIYKIYYENPVNDLIGRVVGKKQGGIYKITNIHNGKCYVGQAVNFANRWKQHIKRGVGAEPITHNKLYPAMLGDGVENFTFEVIEECPQTKLNEREDYWQKFFGAKEYGYSIK